MPRVKRPTSEVAAESSQGLSGGDVSDSTATSDVSAPSREKRSFSSTNPRSTSRKAKKSQSHRVVAVGEESLVHTFVAPGVQLVSEVAKQTGVPHKYAPTPSEVDDIFRPIERFVIRRLPVDVTSSKMAEWDADTRDMVLLATGLLGYGMRVTFDGNSNRTTSNPGTAARTPSATQNTPSPNADSGDTGPSVGPNGVITVDSIQNVHSQTAAEAAMADLWRQTIRPVDSGDA